MKEKFNISNVNVAKKNTLTDKQLNQIRNLGFANRGKIRTDAFKRNISLKLKGRIPWNKGGSSWSKGLTKNTNISVAHAAFLRTGLKHSKDTKNHLREINLGHVVSQETRNKISESLKGNLTWNKGLNKENNDIMRKLSLSQIGKTFIERYGKEKANRMKRNISNSLFGKYSGSKNPSWKGGVTPLGIKIRNNKKYIQWVSSCMARDNWTCGTCNKRGGKLQVHHIHEFSNILKEYNIKTVEDALKCEKLWDIDNGITLCVDCHKETDTYLNNRRIQMKNLRPLIVYDQINERRYATN